MRQRTSLAVLAAALGGAALWWLFPKYDRSADLGRIQLTRRETVDKAREVARGHGIDAKNWFPAARVQDWKGGDWIYLWRHLHPESRVFASLVTPSVSTVTLRQPGGASYVTVAFNANGRLVGFRMASREASQVGHVHATETLDAMANGVLAQYLGEQAPLFRAVNRGVTQSSQLLYSWEYTNPADSPHLLRFEASFSEEHLVKAELTAEPSDSFRESVRTRQEPLGYTIASVFLISFLLLSAAFPSFFRALVRRRLSVKRLISMLALALVLLVLVQRGGGWVEDAQEESMQQFTDPLGRMAGHALLLAFVGCTIVLFYGAGRGLLLPRQHEHWLALDALLSRRFLVRPVGASLLHGLLCGVALAGVPLLIAPFALPAQLNLSSAETLYAFSPIATVFEPLLQIDIFALVFLALPLSRRVRPAWLGLPAFVLLMTIGWFSFKAPYESWVGPGLAVSFLLVAGLWLVEREYGALAALLSGFGMVACWTAAGYFVQSVPELQARGWWVAGPGMVLGLVGLVVMRAGAAVDVAAELAAMRAESATAVLSQRDRFASEFDVARRAQQAMLPAVPAQLGEVSFAASCIPARDVGGDLYDFYPTGDGRFAIGVADVSGKGVPASLYMTLTKGFLAAAGRDSDDLPSTLSQLNSHLHSAGKRKVFVTMALAFFSPEERRIELARAGHNAPLWRRASLGKSEYLTPGGMGLGLTSRLLFERALRVQEIEMEPGDAFVLYSDGVTEAMNETLEQFGEERLQAVLDACDGCDAHATEQAILQAVRAFIGTAPPHDDMTLFVVRV